MNPDQQHFLHQQELPPIANKPNPTEELKAQYEQNFIPRSQVQIVDCYAEITKKNYLPFILALTEHKLQNVNGLDESGYNALHYSTSQGQIIMSKMLVEELGLDSNFQSKNLQNPLMLALNIGCTELIYYYIQQIPKDQLNIQDSCGFNYLIYASKSSQISFFLYFFNEGVDINVKDNSGCTAIHWAAYQNHLEMVKIIERLTGNLKVQDNLKATPLMRAEENCSFKTAKYIKSKEVEQKTFYSKAPLLFSTSIYIAVSILFYLQFYYYLNDKSNYFGILFTILFVYFQGIFFYFIFNGKSRQSMSYKPLQEFNSEIQEQASIQGFPEIDAEVLKSIDFTKLNAALGIKSTSNYNYMHYTISYIKQKLFKQLDHIDFSRYCPTCLEYMPPQTHHCKQVNSCIPNYQHYSHFFGRIINNQNHLLYYCIIGLQQILMILYIYCSVYSFRNQRISYYLVSYFETAYLAYVKNGILNFLVYVFVSYCLAINSYYFILETYGIFTNQTRNEIFNRFKYRYFYKAVINQKNIIWNYYTNTQNLGVEENISNYLAKASEK